MIRRALEYTLIYLLVSFIYSFSKCLNFPPFFFIWFACSVSAQNLLFFLLKNHTIALFIFLWLLWWPNKKTQLYYSDFTVIFFICNNISCYLNCFWNYKESTNLGLWKMLENIVSRKVVSAEKTVLVESLLKVSALNFIHRKPLNAGIIEPVSLYPLCLAISVVYQSP